MTDHLRVALVTNYPVDPSRIQGGVQAVAVRLVGALQQIPGLELHVVHCHSDIDHSQVIREAGVTRHYIAQTRRRVVPNMTSAIGLIAARLREIAPDVVHAHDSPSFALAALRAGYRPIWTLHGLTAEEAKHYRGAFQQLSHALTQYYERRALARVPFITAVSPYLMHAYRAQTRVPWHVIDNPAPEGYFDLPRRPVPGRVLMPATLIPLKDPLTLVRAAAQIRDAIPELSVHLAGAPANPAYAATLRAEITRLDLAEAVTLLGALDAPRLQQEFIEASVVTLPSRQDVSPMALIEAMAAGVPVVASAVGGVPYLVEEDVTGRLVPPAEPAALATALTSLLSEPEISQRMGLAARETARTRFAASRVAAKYLALYREAARVGAGATGHD